MTVRLKFHDGPFGGGEFEFEDWPHGDPDLMGGMARLEIPDGMSPVEALRSGAGRFVMEADVRPSVRGKIIRYRRHSSDGVWVLAPYATVH